ncbi:hypothetical protein Tco_0104303 [Tanacetum coccineum]
MKQEGLKRQRRNSSNDDKISEDLLKEGNKNNIDDLLKRIKTKPSPNVPIVMKPVQPASLSMTPTYRYGDPASKCESCIPEAHSGLQN